MKIVETNLYDVDPQIYKYLIEKLFAQGCSDVYLTPIIMRNGRRGTRVTVAAAEELLLLVIQTLQNETGMPGIEFLDGDGFPTDWEIAPIETKWGQVRTKVARLDGEVTNISLEFEDCKKIAGTHNISLKRVYQILYQRVQYPNIP